jgi:hypothetical protein
MKKMVIAVAVIAGLLLVLLVVNPLLMVVISGGAPKVESDSRIANGELVARLTLTHSDAPMFVVSFDAPRHAVDKLGLGAPAGFRVEALSDEKSDPAWLKDWNRDNVRYAGKLQIAPGIPVEVRFPIKSSQATPFRIGGQFEAGRSFMNSMSFFQIRVGE